MSYQPSGNDNENQSLRKINALGYGMEQDTSLSLGQYGAVYRTGPMASAITGQSFGAIQVLADAIFTNLTATNWTESGSESLASLSVPAGVTLFGNFTGFQLTSGRVIAYKNA